MIHLNAVFDDITTFVWRIYLEVYVRHGPAELDDDATMYANIMQIDVAFGMMSNC